MRDSRKPQLSFRLSADQLKAVLRADTIQDEAVTAMGRTWTEADDQGTGDADIINALDRLGSALAGDPSGPELDRRVEDVEDAAQMPPAETEFGLAEALRLRSELDAVIERLARFNPDAVVPRQVRRAA